MRNIISLLLLMLMGGMTEAQHIEDIRKELYPSFNPVRWSETYATTEDYYPMDYSQWEVGPKAADFEEAFQGYYILDRFLRKRNLELRQGLDEKGKALYAAKNRAWQTYRDKVCNKKWKPAELGYSMMVLNYLYCVNLKTRQRVDSLGGGIPPNEKWRKIPELDPFTESDFKSYDSLVFQWEAHGIKSYKSLKKFVMADVPGEARLAFKEGKLKYVEIEFKCQCEGYLSNYIIKYAGAPSKTSFDQITLETYKQWKGSGTGMDIQGSLEYPKVSLSWSYR